jgi:hypothetical protein
VALTPSPVGQANIRRSPAASRLLVTRCPHWLVVAATSRWTFRTTLLGKSKDNRLSHREGGSTGGRPLRGRLNAACPSSPEIKRPVGVPDGNATPAFVIGLPLPPLAVGSYFRIPQLNSRACNSLSANVRSWHFSDIEATQLNVRFQALFGHQRVAYLSLNDPQQCGIIPEALKLPSVHIAGASSPVRP